MDTSHVVSVFTEFTLRVYVKREYCHQKNSKVILDGFLCLMQECQQANQIVGTGVCG